MIPELLEVAKKDQRVEYDFIINNRIHMFKAIENPKSENIILYIHGLGSNKNWITRFYNNLLANNYIVYSLDLPGHGEDKTPFESFDLTICTEYIKEAIKYIKVHHENCNISLFGSSYGGFVILNAHNEIKKDINKIYLM